MIIEDFYCFGCGKPIKNTEEVLVAPGTADHIWLVATVHNDQACRLNLRAAGGYRHVRGTVSEWRAEGLEVTPWGDRGLAKMYAEDQVAS